MGFVHSHKTGGRPYAAELCPGARVTLQLLPGADYGVLMFRDDWTSFHMIVPFGIFPQLVTIIRGAGLDTVKRHDG